MIETGALPAIKAMTLVAVGGKLAEVVRICGFVETPGHGSSSTGAESCEDGSCAPLMARFTGGRRVCAEQREAVQMLLDLVDVHLPALNGVAVFARGAHLPAVEIGVAGGALTAGVLEDQVALWQETQVTFAVHPPQWVRSVGVVIELDTGAQRPPCGRCVAVLTTHVDRPVRIAGMPPHRLLRLGAGREPGADEDKQRRGRHPPGYLWHSAHLPRCSGVNQNRPALPYFTPLVAQLAGHTQMPAFQPESSCRVVEMGWLPSSREVAIPAIGVLPRAAELSACASS